MQGLVKVFVLVMVIFTTMVTATGRRRQRNLRFGNFDDYLISVVSRTSAHNLVLKPGASTTTTAAESPTQETPRSEGEDEDADADDGAPRGVEDRDVLGYFRDVPQRHWSCCMLGILAGDKGFHCHVQFYAAKIARNNRNRAHSRKMMFHGRDAVPNWGRDIMTTFGRCVTREVGEFHRCCRTATDEVRERQIWQRFRQPSE